MEAVIVHLDMEGTILIEHMEAGVEVVHPTVQGGKEAKSLTEARGQLMEARGLMEETERRTPEIGRLERGMTVIDQVEATNDMPTAKDTRSPSFGREFRLAVAQEHPGVLVHL